MEGNRPVFVKATAAAVPESVHDTEQLLSRLSGRLSDGLKRSIQGLGVDSRHSVLANFEDFVVGDADPVIQFKTSDIAGQAVESCLQSQPVDPAKIGLLIAATNTPDRALPCLASELMATPQSTLPRSVNVVSMQGQGCSVLPKAVDVVRWFLCENPGKLALVVMAEAQTAHTYQLEQCEHYSFAEIKDRGSGQSEQRGEVRRSEQAIQNMLFGDGAVAVLLGAAETPVKFGKTCHLTNEAAGDFELLFTPDRSERPLDGGTDLDYRMSSKVPSRGAFYAQSVISGVTDASRIHAGNGDCVSPVLIHTGSRKILDGVCSMLGESPDSPRVSASYRVLSEYGNLSSASVGFMLANNSFDSGAGVMATFGAGFSASALEVAFN